LKTRFLVIKRFAVKIMPLITCIVWIIIALLISTRETSSLELLRLIMYVLILYGGASSVIMLFFHEYRSISYSKTTCSTTRHKIIELIIGLTLLLYSLYVGIVSISCRYEFHKGPQGFDTPFYAKLALDFQENLLATISHLRLFATLLTLTLIKLFGIYDGLILLPYLTGSIMIIAFFIYASTLFRSYVYGGFTSILLAGSYTFKRLTYDLFGNATGLSLMLLILSYLESIGRELRHLKISSAIIFMALLFLTTLSHPLSGILSTLLALFYFIFILLLHRVRIKIKSISFIFIVSLIIFLLFLLLSSYSYYITLLSKDVSLRFINLINPNLHLRNYLQFYIIKKENFLIIVLSCIGTLLLLIRSFQGKEIPISLIIWTSFISWIIIISSYNQTYRLHIILPFSVISSYAIMNFHKFLSHLIKIKLRLYSIKLAPPFFRISIIHYRNILHSLITFSLAVIIIALWIYTPYSSLDFARNGPTTIFKKSFITRKQLEEVIILRNDFYNLRQHILVVVNDAFQGNLLSLAFPNIYRSSLENLLLEKKDPWGARYSLNNFKYLLLINSFSENSINYTLIEVSKLKEISNRI